MLNIPLADLKKSTRQETDKKQTMRVTRKRLERFWKYLILKGWKPKTNAPLCMSQNNKLLLIKTLFLVWIHNIQCRLSQYWLCPLTGMTSCLFPSCHPPVTQMRTSVWTAKSAGERHATTPLGASAVSAPLASTTSRPAEAAQTSTSAPPARTPASSAALTQTGATSVDVHPDTSVQDKGMLMTWLCVRAVYRCF